MGGTSDPNRDALYNLLALDPDVHNGGPQSVHGNPVWSHQNGFLVTRQPGSPPPRQYPVRLRCRWWVLLDSVGGYVPIPRSVVESTPRS